MAYRRASDGAYPCGQDDIRQAHPNKSLPSVISDDDAVTLGYVPIAASEPPTPGQGQIAVEGVPEQIEGVWTQTWTLEAAPLGPVPDTVSNFQCRAVLLSIPDGEGTLFDVVNAALNQTGGAALEAWNHSPYFARSSALLNQVAQQHSISPETLDTMFRQAAVIHP